MNGGSVIYVYKRVNSKFPEDAATPQSGFGQTCEARMIPKSELRSGFGMDDQKLMRYIRLARDSGKMIVPSPGLWTDLSGKDDPKVRTEIGIRDGPFKTRYGPKRYTNWVCFAGDMKPELKCTGKEKMRCTPWSDALMHKRKESGKF
jgi:hypothetical protein